MTKSEAEQILEGRNGDELYDAYGPSKLGNRLIWEGIVKDVDDEWQGRYILVQPDRSYGIYEDFQALMLEVNALYDASSGKKLHTTVATIAPAIMLAVAIIVCAYLVMFKDNYSAWAAAFMFFSIVASGCALYFGSFKQPRIPGAPL